MHNIREDERSLEKWQEGGMEESSKNPPIQNQAGFRPRIYLKGQLTQITKEKKNLIYH